MPVTLMMMVHRDFHFDDGVMFDSLRLMTVSRAERKRWTKKRMGVIFSARTRLQESESHAQELGLRSVEGCGGNTLLNDPDAVVGPILLAIDEKLVVTFELFRRILNIYSQFHRSLFG